jgi:hypothetical protein
MPHVSTLRIYFGVDPEQSIAEALEGLPKCCSESFQEHSKNCWSGEFPISCPVAPELAEGDFVDDVAPYFPQLLRLKKFYNAVFELQIAVGLPGPESFKLEGHLVALLAALGATVEAKTTNAAE